MLQSIALYMRHGQLRMGATMHRAKELVLTSPQDAVSALKERAKQGDDAPVFLELKGQNLKNVIIAFNQEGEL